MAKWHIKMQTQISNWKTFKQGSMWTWTICLTHSTNSSNNKWLIKTSSIPCSSNMPTITRVCLHQQIPETVAHEDLTSRSMGWTTTSSTAMDRMEVMTPRIKDSILSNNSSKGRSFLQTRCQCSPLHSTTTWCRIQANSSFPMQPPIEKCSFRDRGSSSRVIRATIKMANLSQTINRHSSSSSSHLKCKCWILKMLSKNIGMVWMRAVSMECKADRISTSTWMQSPARSTLLLLSTQKLQARIDLVRQWGIKIIKVRCREVWQTTIDCKLRCLLPQQWPTWPANPQSDLTMSQSTLISLRGDQALVQSPNSECKTKWNLAWDTLKATIWMINQLSQIEEDKEHLRVLYSHK